MKETISTTWGQVAATVEVDNDGDILAPLKRVEAQYRAKATKMALRRTFWDSTTQYYLNAAESVRKLHEAL